MDRNIFPNGLIFIIAAGVIFVAGSYALFGINESTGKPRVFNWVFPQTEVVQEVTDGAHTLTLQSDLGSFSFSAFDESYPDAVSRFLAYMQEDPSRSFSFDTLRYGEYVHASAVFDPVATDGSEFYPRGTLAVRISETGNVSDMIILLGERTLPEGYVPIAAIEDGNDTLAPFDILPLDQYDLLSEPIVIEDIVIKQNVVEEEVPSADEEANIEE